MLKLLVPAVLCWFVIRSVFAGAAVTHVLTCSLMGWSCVVSELYTSRVHENLFSVMASAADGLEPLHQGQPQQA